MINLKKKIAILAVAAPLGVTLTTGCLPNNPATPEPVQKVAVAVSQPTQVQIPPPPPPPAPTPPPPAPEREPHPIWGDIDPFANGEQQAEAEQVLVYVDWLPPGECRSNFRGGSSGMHLHTQCGKE